MKKLFLLCASAMLLFSCSTDSNADLVSNESLSVNSQELYQRLLNSTNNVGIYKGVFTTDDSESRATVQIMMPSERLDPILIQGRPTQHFQTNPFPIAIITLNNGETYRVSAKQFPGNNVGITEMEFTSDQITFKFSVNADGTNAVVDAVSFKGKSSAMLVSKHTTLAPITTITGSYVCIECNNNPFITGTEEQTFNVMIDEASGEMTSQLVLGGSSFRGIGVQNNCVETGNTTNCEITSGDGQTNVGFEVSGQAITWAGDHNSIDLQNCASGTWALATINYGNVTGDFTSDSACN